MKTIFKALSLFFACTIFTLSMASCSPKKTLGAISGITGSDALSSAVDSDTQSSRVQSDKQSSSKDSNSVSKPDKDPLSTSSKQSDKDNFKGAYTDSQTGFVFTPVDTTGMTDYQKAIVLTAESYWIRQSRLQYEDTRLISTKARDQWRWGFIKLNALESYTSQNVGYSNCAAWTHEAYFNALDLDIKQYQTAQLCRLKMSKDQRVVFKAEKDGLDFSTAEKREELARKVKEIIEPGDLVVYVRESTGWGHVMMYVGNNMMMHCSGSNYDWDARAERFETSGIRYEPIDKWFDESSSLYLFDKKTTSIIRPLKTFSGKIPQKTLDRMTTMRGVIAEKLCSVYKGVTVNYGDEVTYTIKLTNCSAEKKTLNITDTVPQHTTYVSGAQSKNDSNLCWKVSVGAGKTVSVSYTVRVETPCNFIEGDSGKVENIDLKCHDLYVKKTLTKAEQKKIVEAVDNLKNSDLRSTALLSAIYTDAIGWFPISKDHDEAFVLNQVFMNYENTEDWPSRWQKLRTPGNTYQNMLAPDLYGGRQVIDESITSGRGIERIRLVTEKNLVVGDVIFANNPETEIYTQTEYTFKPTAYIFLGDKLLNLTTMQEIAPEPMLEQILCERHFCVLRPSIMMERSN